MDTILLFISQVFKIFFGADATGAMVFAQLLQFFLGVGVIAYVDAKLRNPVSKRTPANWDWWFYIKDNFARFVGTFLIGLLVIICGAGFVSITGISLPESISGKIPFPLFAGLGSDAIIVWLREKFRVK